MRSTSRIIGASALALLACASVPSSSLSAGQGNGGDGRRLSLEQVAPELSARLLGVERAQGVLLGALMSGQGIVDEAAIYQRLIHRVADRSDADRPDADADNGYATLGTRGAQIIRRTQAFHHEVLAIFATLPPGARRKALDDAVLRYRSRPEVALADLPKDMTLLYDHPYTSFVPPRPGESEPRRELAYPTLTGFVWAAHWYQLAVQESLEGSDPLERDRGLAIVADRFMRKLSGGTPPDTFPTELPLAPAIAPGLVATHDRAAAIIDNLNMMMDVLFDVLVRRGVADRRSAVDTVLDQFTDRQYRCVPADEWIVVALRHSIFEQGGFAWVR